MFSCQHKHAMLPRMGFQKCPDCGARRRYRQFGSVPGPWRKDVKILAYAEEQPVRLWKRIREAMA